MYHIIVNAAAGAGKAGKCIPAIERYMESHNLRYVIWKTKKPMDAKYLAQRACGEKSSGIICVGGDGTVHETAAGMVYTGVPLGIIPAGSGNDFIHSLSYKKNLPVMQILDMICKVGHTKNIDMIKMSGFSFLNIGSIGLDAEIADYASALKGRFKRSAYLASTLRNVFTFNNFPMRLIVDSMELDGEFTLIAACNGKYYGGGFQIAPDAELDDGKITLCVMRNLSKLTKVTLFPTVLVGAHTGIKGVEFFRCQKVTAHFEGTRNVNLDGNIYKLDSPIRFEIMPWAIKAIVP